MSTEIRVPTLGESITEATIGQWYKQAGDTVSADEPLVELETDKVAIEVPAPGNGVLGEILAGDGETVEVGALLATMEANGAAVAAAPSAAKTASPPPAPAPAPAQAAQMPPSPAAGKIMQEKNIAPESVNGSGKRGQILKQDVAAMPNTAQNTPAQPETRAQNSAREERVPMSRLRQTIAKRLKEAQNTAAMLTTFNEVDMGALMTMRKEYRDLFEKKHGVRLGFMGFFTLAVCHALREIPAVNAEISGTDIVYKQYCNIGIAVGTDKGLVVPVIRNAEQLSLAGIEKSINDFGLRARDGKLTLEEMQGGTFTISNGGVYGSLMSTPILNAPQSGILGLHKIQERPVVVAGEIQIRPMMYLALSYDHRIVDGKEAVTFLVRIKESLETPERLIMDL